MLDRLNPAAEEQPETAASQWIAALNAALAGRSSDDLATLFAPDSHWRNLLGISWHFATFSGRPTVVAELLQRASAVHAGEFRIATDALIPRRAVVAGREVVEAIFTFETANGPGTGAVRLLRDDNQNSVAWTISTLLDFDRICAARAEHAASESHTRDFAAPDWTEQRQASRAYADREPDVLIVGGGHAGIAAAVECKRIGLDALIVDRERRIGDNWRLRYRGLKLHNKTPVNHLRYLPFPQAFPDYIPKDKIANWLESYVDIMELDFWTETSFEGASYDDATQRWTVTLQRTGGVRTMHPKHIVLATSVSGTPNIPAISGIERFNGQVLHSSQFAAGREWAGRSVVVFGTGTSAHDICQELHAAGSHVTMVQRSPTMIVNVEPAQLYDRAYLGDGPPIGVRDILNSSLPLPVMKIAHKIITDEVKALDAPLLSRLEAAGFRLEFGEDGTGWPLKFRSRGGGYYFNVGCSELIADGKIRLIQAADIAAFNADGLALKDGSALNAELFVLATGQGPRSSLGQIVRRRCRRARRPCLGF
ncbi:NAD(P)-binding domain-containing protein [Bradyrhizobium genosp. P]|uniref:NAD(P)-binding domain-containing protein n=1 Tax=Bradyrhizobium genosp. P TaxID=83641 RepID=UPI003CEAF0E4